MIIKLFAVTAQNLCYNICLKPYEGGLKIISESKNFMENLPKVKNFL